MLSPPPQHLYSIAAFATEVTCYHFLISLLLPPVRESDPICGNTAAAYLPGEQPPDVHVGVDAERHDEDEEDHRPRLQHPAEHVRHLKTAAPSQLI